MRKITYITLLLGIFVCSCKKNRVCECKNTNNTYYAGEIDATRGQAKKYCKDLSTGSTECYLKK